MINIQTILNSYSQIFFSKNKILGVILILVSFFDFWTGLNGFFAVIVANQVALWFKFNTKSIETGMYGFNSLLVGLGTGLMFQPSFSLMLIVIALSILTLFVSLTLEGIFTKYALPYISIPFILVMWVVNMAMNDLSYIGVSQRGIFLYNELYALGGQNFVNFYEWLQSFHTPESLRIYFLSLGAILFQFNELAGILIAIALLISSRIAFTLSLVGFYIAYFFYQQIGVNFSELSYTYIGFNYILTAIAIGGFFFVPSRWSYLWLILLLPITVILTFGLSKFFAFYQLSSYSLPFNITVLLFLYVMKLRTQKGEILVEPVEQRNSPESNLYFHRNIVSRLPSVYYLPVYLPFMGEWTVSQAHNGEHTHKDAWQHAWDFVITNKNGEQFQNQGDYCTDYFCYNKPVVAAANGTVVEVVDGIGDNIIGDINTLHNWGNSIVLKHSDYLYSQVSHLKSGTLVVKIGDIIQKGQVIALAGNSGRSPYPHLHFQFQVTPFIGSPTLNYPFAHVIKKHEQQFDLKDQYFALKDDHLQNLDSIDLLAKAFHFIPGQIVKYNVSVDEVGNKIFASSDEFDTKANVEWHIKTDSFNVSYFYCPKTKSVAYFHKDEYVFQFTDFLGDKSSDLYWFYLAFYKLQFGFYPGIKITDQIPQDKIFDKVNLIIQDFIAPFYLYLSGEFQLIYQSVNDDFSPSEINLQSNIRLNRFSKTIKQITIKSNINSKGIANFTVQSER